MSRSPAEPSSESRSDPPPKRAASGASPAAGLGRPDEAAQQERQPVFEPIIFTPWTPDLAWYLAVLAGLAIGALPDVLHKLGGGR